MERHNLVLPFFQWRFDTDDRRILEKNLADKINYLANTSPEETEKLKEKVNVYAEMLISSKLRDENVARKLDWGMLRYLAVIVGFPVFLAGYISNLIPFILPRYICDKLIKDPRFYSSVYIGSGTVLYLIYFPILLILAGIFGGWTGFLLGLLVPLAGYLVLFYREIFWERFRTLRFTIKSITNMPLINDLKARRHEIQSILDNIKIK
jgi:hypothetical protein